MRFTNGWAIGAALLCFLGCGGDTNKPGKGPTAKEVAKSGEVGKKTEAAKHDHGAEGPHGGALAEWGEEEYHPEFTVDHSDQTATVYILDGSAKKAKPIAVKEISLTLKLKPAVSLTLKAKPQEGDAPGSSSRFVGEHAALGKVMDFAGTLAAEINGKPYSGDFKEEAHGDHDAKGGHSKANAKHGSGLDDIAKEAVGGTPFEKELYLKPGGIYTAADIKANGDTVPSVKFAGKHWEHADDIKPGDPICPVTDNKGESACSWIVNGKTYLFCCPPCIDKFVKWAKNSPEKIKDPSAYRAK